MNKNALNKFMWNITELKLQFQRLYFSWLPLASMRTKFLRKHHIFEEMGENVFWQPRVYPADAEMIKIHNNVAIAANVSFIMHDISWMVLEKIPKTNKRKHRIVGYKGCIEIYDNVFIGANVTILPDVSIGPNAIIGAGAVVTKDVPAGSIVGGCPQESLENLIILLQADLTTVRNSLACPPNSETNRSGLNSTGSGTKKRSKNFVVTMEIII